MAGFPRTLQKFITQHIRIAALSGAGTNSEHLHRNNLRILDVSIVAKRFWKINLTFAVFE